MYVVMTAMTLSIICEFLSSLIYFHDFGENITLWQQKYFTKCYLNTLKKNTRVAFVFDVRNVTKVEPRAILEHVRVFKELKALNKAKVAGFGVLLESDMLRGILDGIFTLVPPSSPFVITKEEKKAFKHVGKMNMDYMDLRRH